MGKSQHRRFVIVAISSIMLSLASISLLTTIQMSKIIDTKFNSIGKYSLKLFQSAGAANSLLHLFIPRKC